MSRSLTNRFILAIAVLGALIAVFLTAKHFLPDLSAGCTSGPGGCEGVLGSRYSKIGPIPTAALGLGMYLTFFALALKRGHLLAAEQAEQRARAAVYAGATPPDEVAAAEAELGVPNEVEAAEPVVPPSRFRPEIRRLDLMIWGLSLLGVGISWWLQYTAIFVVKGFCPWCFSSALLVTILFALASGDYWLDGRAMSGEQKMLVGVTGFVLVLMGIMYYPTIVETIQVRPDVEVAADLRQFVVRDDLHIKGDPNARFLIVKFADYQCPGCKETAGELDKLLAARPKDFRLAYRNFPLAKHTWARDAARAAEAAAKQGKFWEMHDIIYRHQEEMESDSFDRSKFAEFAQRIKLDVAKFRKDASDPASDQVVERDMADGNAAVVSMTPTLFVVTPKSVTRFQGMRPFKEQLLNNPSNPLWKE